MNKTFCSLYFIEVKKDLLKKIPREALKGVLAGKIDSRYYEVYIPKSKWFPKGFVITVKAEYAVEAKASVYSHILDRIEKKELEDNNYPIVIDCKNNLHNIQVEADGRCHWCEGKRFI